MAINKVIYGNQTLIDLTSDTVDASDILNGKTAHNKAGNKITGTIPIKTGQTYTPGTTNQTISSGQYIGAAQVILGDPNLIAENIKKDVTIFGITGTYQGGLSIIALVVERYLVYLSSASVSEETLTSVGTVSNTTLIIN